MGLLQYFDKDEIFGRDSMRFNKLYRLRGHALKSNFIHHHYGTIPPSNILFVDNDDANMQYVKAQGVANVFDGGNIENGLKPIQMQWIVDYCDEKRETRNVNSANC